MAAERRELITSATIAEVHQSRPIGRPQWLGRIWLAAPSLALVVLFSYYPALRALAGSLTSWDGFNPPQFVGFENFVEYVQSFTFGAEVHNLAILVIAGVFISLLFPFLAAELTLGINWARGQSALKYLLVIPMVIPQVILINIWAYLLNPNDGLVDAFLSLFHVQPIQWFGNSSTALLSILLIGFPWVSSLGYLIFLAGLQGISREVIDAARIDKCTGIRRIWQIDVPLSIPQIRFVVIIAGIGIVQNFIPILLLTNGGPGNATMVPGLDMYQSAFSNNELGYGMAIGTLMFIAMLVVTFVVLRVLRPRT